jgi:acetate kinase
MDTVLVVNAGSSSVKFQVFAADGKIGPRRLIKGKMDGIGTRPRLRAEAADKTPLIDQTYVLEQVEDVPAAREEKGEEESQEQAPAQERGARGRTY